MTTTVDQLKKCIVSGTSDCSILPEAVEEMERLQKRVNELEEVLIILVRTGWPWDEDGNANGIMTHAKDGFASAIKEARELLQLNRSKITRTEPRT